MTIRREDCDASDIYGPEPYKAAPTREQQLEALVKELEGKLNRCRWAAKVADNEKQRADRLQAENNALHREAALTRGLEERIEMLQAEVERLKEVLK